MIKFPEYFDTPKVLNAFKTLSNEELYVFFDCNSRQAFAGLMKKYFPGKPANQQYREYVRGLLADELDTEPRVQQAVVVEAKQAESRAETAKPVMSTKPKKEQEYATPVVDTGSEWLNVEVPQPRVSSSSGVSKGSSSAVASGAFFREGGPTEEEIEQAIEIYNAMVPYAVATSIKEAARFNSKTVAKDENTVIEEYISKGYLIFDPRPYLVQETTNET